MISAIPFPNIDPVLFAIGPFAIRWYALAFIAGLLIGWRYMRGFVAKPPNAVTAEQVDDFLLWVTLGVVLGGRFGYVAFYNLEYYLSHPLAILRVWQGGMSFHGGLLGIVVTTIMFAHLRKLNCFALGDALVCAAPIGLFLGRVANFVNGELYGRVTDVPWGFVFPHGGDLPRHPSQLYEAALEGIVLFILLYWLARRYSIRLRPGLLTGVFLIGYSIARVLVELVRQPDVQVGFLLGGTTMGQWLTAPVLLFGLYLVARPYRAS